MKMSKTSYLIFAIVMICVGVVVFLITNKEKGKVDPTPTNEPEQKTEINYQDKIILSTDNLVVPVGSSNTFEITIKDAVGRVDITSNDENIATIDNPTVWLESISNDEPNTKTITVNGQSVGTTELNITLDDVATFETEEQLTGSFTINITVQ